MNILHLRSAAGISSSFGFYNSGGEGIGACSPENEENTQIAFREMSQQEIEDAEREYAQNVRFIFTRWPSMEI